jgi:hypothetical protein
MKNVDHALTKLLYPRMQRGVPLTSHLARNSLKLRIINSHHEPCSF